MNTPIHTAFPLVFVLIILSSIPDISHGKSEEDEGKVCLSQKRCATNYASLCTIMQNTDVINGAFTCIIEELVYYTPPRSSGNDSTWETVMQKTGVISKAYKSLLKELVNLPPKSCGIGNECASVILQTAAEEMGSFADIFPQMLILISKKSQTGTLDNALENRIQLQTAASNRAFRKVFAQMVEFFSKTGRIDKSWASAIMQTTDVVAEGFTDVIKQLTCMPPPSSGVNANAILQTTSVVNGAFTNLIKLLACMPPPSTGIDDGYVSKVMQTNAVTCGAFFSVIKQLTQAPKQCTADLWASAIKQKTVVTTRSFTNLIELLVFPQSCNMAKSSMASNKQESATEQATDESIKDFKTVIKELTAFYTACSKKCGSDKEWEGAIKKTSKTIIESFTDLLKGLEEMPPPCCEDHEKWAKSILQTTDVLTGSFTILVDELVFLQSTGMSKKFKADKAKATELVEATRESTEAFTKAVAKLAGLITKEDKNVEKHCHKDNKNHDDDKDHKDHKAHDDNKDHKDHKDHKAHDDNKDHKDHKAEHNNKKH